MPVPVVAAAIVASVLAWGAEYTFTPFPLVGSQQTLDSFNPTPPTKFQKFQPSPLFLACCTPFKKQQTMWRAFSGHWWEWIGNWAPTAVLPQLPNWPRPWSFGKIEIRKRWKDHLWLVVSTYLKNISQHENLPQVGMKIRNIWNHHLDLHLSMGLYGCFQKIGKHPTFWMVFIMENLFLIIS